MITIEKFKELQEASWGEEILLWIKDNKIKGEKGNLIEFTKHRFLRDPYEDWAPIQTARKASQVGFSTKDILKSLWAARHKDWNVIYTLPTFADVGQFVPSKVNQIILHNPCLTRWTKDKDTIFQKKVGNSFIYYRGTISKKPVRQKLEAGPGIMFTSDVNIHDESDRSDQLILEQYESRLEASDYKGRWYFSNPTVPGTLTQQLWDLSDQKHWFIKCPRCGKYQWLDYFRNIDKKRKIFICQKCGRKIDDETRRMGFWVKRYKDREISGYWINHLICPWQSAADIIKAEETKTRQYFYNFVLGLPYRGSDVIVDEEMILKNIESGPNLKVDNVIGVDTGLTMHYVLGNKQGIFEVGSTKDWDDIENRMKKYNALAIFDALGDLTHPRKLRDKYRGRVWLCYFKREGTLPKQIKWDSKTMAVYTGRSPVIQRVIDDFVDGEIKFHLRQEDLREYIEHWETLYQITEKDSLGMKRKRWETEGENHYLFATIYFFLGLMKRGTGKVIDWSKDSTPKAHDVKAPSPKKIAEEQEARRDQDWRT